MANTKKIQLPVIIAGLQSKVDGSIKITLETRELPANDAADLFQLRNKEAWCFLAANRMDQVMVPAEKPDSLIGGKTPAQRLRNVLFVLWKEKGSQGDFEDFYKSSLERIIEKFKEALP